MESSFISEEMKTTPNLSNKKIKNNKKNSKTKIDVIEEDNDSEKIYDSETPNRFCVDKAKTGKSKCRYCSKLIEKDLLRIGKYAPYKGKIITLFYHSECVFKLFERARHRENCLQNLCELDGIENITELDREHLESSIKTFNEQIKVKPKNTLKNDRKPTKQITPGNRKKNLSVRTEPAIKILFANADQFTSPKKNELLVRIQKHKPLIVAITEVKPKNSKKERSLMDYQLENYSLHPINLENDKGRGMAVYIYKSMEKPCADITATVNFDECCLIEIRLRGGDLMLFACCYRSPTQSKTSDVNNTKLNELLNVIAKKNYSHRCIVGDFNFKDINWESWTTTHGPESKEQKFIDTVKDCFFFQHVQGATRKRGNDEPSTLDLILTDEEMQVSDVKHLAPLGKSDHSAIIFDFHCYLDYTKPKANFQYSKGDFQKMKDFLTTTNWVEHFKNLSLSADEEAMWQNIKNKLTEVRDKFVPQSNIAGTPSWKSKYQYPLSRVTRNAINVKNRLYRKWIKSSGEERTTQIWIEYAKARNKVNSLVRKEK